MAKNKILVNLLLGNGHSQEKFEVSIYWEPINFMIHNEFLGNITDIVEELIRGWVANNKMQSEMNYELIFQRVIERDDDGVVRIEYFEIINVDIG